MAALVLKRRTKRDVASYFKTECTSAAGQKQITELLDDLLDPTKSIDQWEIIDWCRWLIAGGNTPDEFIKTVRHYDNATTCGLVWTQNFVAYRCRTCGISPCMSLCADCFQAGNHEGHDFNMFRSQAGGACDCGDPNVMKQCGFCPNHGPEAHTSKPSIPTDLLSLSEVMMPRFILRLIQHLRDESKNGDTLDIYRQAVLNCDNFLTFLHTLVDMGAAMRQVLTKALTNPQSYKNLTEVSDVLGKNTSYELDSQASYLAALASLVGPQAPPELEESPNLQKELVHKTFLEEIMFWTVKYEFPQKIVTLLLNMLPGDDYKEHFTRAFVQHYSRISIVLAKSIDADTLSNRVVHVSVQLFSNETLALRMAEDYELLHIMVVSLTHLMKTSCIQSTLEDADHNFHTVVNCAEHIMKDHCYWPLVSDLNNVLTHKPVAYRFMEDRFLLELWFNLISLLQGMNVNQRELSQHVEYEPHTYYAAFSAELESSASPMWALISHCKDEFSQEYTRNVLQTCLSALHNWFDAIGMTDKLSPYQISFHLPLHRYLAVFMSQALHHQNMQLKDVLPSAETLKLVTLHPLQLQVAYYEILCGMWVRNGLQIKGQAMTYVQCHFCNSMLDADLYLLQVCASQLDPDWFISTVIERFHVTYLLMLLISQPDAFLKPENEMPMLEGMLLFLITLLSIRSNLGMSDEELSRSEMVSLLCMSDRTHSQLMDMMPEKCGYGPQNKDFESTLKQVADYKGPNFEAGGTMLQGTYMPKGCVWEEDFDPVYVLLRAVHRRDFQSAMDRYTEYLKQSGKFQGTGNPWPPFRIPGPILPAYNSLKKLLHCRTLHSILFTILYKAVTEPNIPDQVVYLCIFLLEMTLITPSMPVPEKVLDSCTKLQDRPFTNWFPSDCIFTNLCHSIEQIEILHWNRRKQSESVEKMEMDFDDSDLNLELGDMFEDTSYSFTPGNNPGIIATYQGHGALEALDESPALPPFPQPLAITHIESSALMVQAMSLQPVSSAGQVALPGPSSTVTLTGTYSQALSITDGTVAIPATLTPPGDLETLSDGDGTVAIPGSLVPLGMLALPPVEETTGQYLALPGPTNIGSSVNGHMEVDHMAIVATTDSSITANSSTNVLVMQRVGLNIRNKQGKALLGVESPKALHHSQTRTTIKIGESLISLLLKLHSKLSGKPGTYIPESRREQKCVESRIGDGPHFVGQLLDKIGQSNETCCQKIVETCDRLWPGNKAGRQKKSTNQETVDRNERRRRARERQQKLMEEFASQRKAFMEQTMGSDGVETPPYSKPSDIDEEETLLDKEKVYDCVICGQTMPSLEERPIGLVTLLQASSVLGHRRLTTSEPKYLPLNEKEKCLLDDTCEVITNRRYITLQNHFDESSCLLSVNIGWDGGVYVQTCGHYLHLDCHKSYIEYLRNQQAQQMQSHLAIERGEYSCPLCRQLSNAVIPCVPDRGDIALVKCHSSDMQEVVLEMANLMFNSGPPLEASPLTKAMGSVMEDLTNAAFKLKAHCQSAKSECCVFQFVSSIARINLEIDLVQRGGTLCLNSVFTPKRSCFVPLMQVLAMHLKVLPCKPYTLLLSQVTGVSLNDDSTSLSVYDYEVPLFLKDASALLLQLVLTLPLLTDKAYYTCLVKIMYNVAYIQSLSILSCKLQADERLNWRQDSRALRDDCVKSLKGLLGLIVDYLEHSLLYEDDSPVEGSDICWAVETVETSVREMLLPFLRIAALMQHQLFKETLPAVCGATVEFPVLCNYLGLCFKEDSNSDTFSSSHCLHWPVDDPKVLIQNWCQDFINFINSESTIGRILLIHGLTWNPPQLLNLPHSYDKIFQHYRKKQCEGCNSTPKEPAVCLVCGTFVCLRDTCCRQQNVNEAVVHSINCGAGTAMYLIVNSSTIIVIRGKRACLWGSVYLDSFGEEDRDLKRGKPLYLSEERYKLLEQQWLTHSFDHTNKRWIFHKDSL